MLDGYIADAAMYGWFVVERNEKAATAVLALPGHRINHLLHLILSLLTAGLWLIVWLLLACFPRREKRLMVSITETGEWLERKVSV
jgi:hypothetical protein